MQTGVEVEGGVVPEEEPWEEKGKLVSTGFL